MGPGGGELTRLLPDLPLRIGKLPSPVRADPDTERHRLHTAVADLLAGVTRERPALLVLEDGHWADASTLLLLRYLARAAGNARVLLLATFRDTEAEVPETLAETLADLRRSDDVVRLRLEGLSPEEVTDLVRAATGGEPGPELRELAQAIHDLTRGNAFLVCELWRALVEARRRRDGRRARPGRASARGARQPPERPRGRQPATVPPRAAHQRPARARRNRRDGVRPRRSPACRKAGGSGTSGRI